MTPPQFHRQRGIARPVGAFLIAVIVFSVLLVVVQVAADIDPNLIALFQFGPSMALIAIWLLLREQTRARLPMAPQRLGRFWRRMAIAAGVMTVYAITTWLVARSADVIPVEPSLSGWKMAAFLVLSMLGVLGEEFGWRGFLQPAVERRIGRVRAALVVGMIWSCWHVDRFADPVVFGVFAVFSVGLSLVMGYVCGAHGGNAVSLPDSSIGWPI